MNSWNCVDTGFFLCSPAIFAYGEKAMELGASELADCVRLVAKDGCAQVSDVTGKYWVDVDTKNDINRAKKIACCALPEKMWSIRLRRSLH